MGKYSKIYVDETTGEMAVFDESAFQGGISNIVVNVETPTEIWTIQHMKNSNKFLCEITNEDSELIIPESLVINDNNTIVVTFTEPTAGKASLIFFE
jgi:hypothetical protein